MAVESHEYESAAVQGPAFLTECGWTPIDVRSMRQNAAELKPIPLLMRLFALFPDPKGTKPKQIWAESCSWRRPPFAPL
jgi:hypothetical protein